MQDYPVLAAVKRFGTQASFVLAVIVLVTVSTFAWSLSPITGIGLGVGAGALILVLALSYVELVRLIVAMLIPE